MLDLAKNKTVVSLEMEGVWVTLQPGVRVKLARWDNPNMKRRQFEIGLEYRTTAKAGLVSYETFAEIQIRVMAETILLDWEGIGENDELIEPTFENRERILREHGTFRDMLIEESRNQNHYLEEVTAESLGKPRRSRRGRPSTGSMNDGSTPSPRKANGVISNQSRNAPSATS